MSEEAIADFVARVVADTAASTEPVRGRVVLSQRRLVLATGDGTATVPLSDIFDINVGHVPPDISEFFDDTVTVGYTRNGGKHTAVVEADADTIERFADLLFRARLSGTAVYIVHPARVGGRVTDAAARRARLRLPEDALVFEGLDDDVCIDLDAVVGFERASREIDGTERPVLRVSHTDDGRTLTSEMALDSGAKMNVLGRYVRLEYSAVMADLEDVDIPDEEMEVLVALHSAGADTNLAGMLGRDATEVSMLLDRLDEKGLVTEDRSLTAQGKMAVEDRLENVNA